MLVDDDTTAGRLLAELRRSEPDAAGRDELRRRVVEHYLPRAVRLARRFHDRGEPQADLDQVAALGLLKAVDGFDPDRGVPFAGYLVPMVVGELKRHFRDTGWDVRVPRRLQELKIDVTRATQELAGRLGHEPSVDEIAGELGLAASDVRDALLAARAYESRSLNEALSAHQEGDIREPLDLLGGPDAGLERVPDHVTLRGLLRRLPEREARLLSLRFFDDLNQNQIGEELGISQMQVSRLLSQVLTWLRQEMNGAHQRMPLDRTPPLRLRVVPARGHLIARLTAPVGSAGAHQLRDRLVDAAVRFRPTRLIVDLGRLTAMPPRVLAAIHAAHRACAHVHGQLVLLNAAPPVAAAVRRAGLGRLLGPTSTPHLPPAGGPRPGPAATAGWRARGAPGTRSPVG